MKVVLTCLLAAATLTVQRPHDVVSGAAGDLIITPVAHATVHIASDSKVILVDPTLYGGWDGPHQGGVVPNINYGGLKPPTLILVTDIHGDHFDPDAIAKLKTPTTRVVVPNIPGWQYPAG